MLNLAAAKVFLCVEPTDMRKSYDTLALRVRDHLGGDPQSGSWFVFRGKRGDRLKILYWDVDGYAIWQNKDRADYTHSGSFTKSTRYAHNRIGGLA